MLEIPDWEKVYLLWRMGEAELAERLSLPCEVVSVSIPGAEPIATFDWLSKEEAAERKREWEQHPEETLLFRKLPGKGIAKTAELLLSAKSDEELAAVWVAATSLELAVRCDNRDICRYAEVLAASAREFLQRSFSVPLWSVQVRHFIPAIKLPHSVTAQMNCEGVKPLLGLIQLNTALLLNSTRILQLNARTPLT